MRLTFSANIIFFSFDVHIRYIDLKKIEGIGIEETGKVSRERLYLGPLSHKVKVITTVLTLFYLC